MPGAGHAAVAARAAGTGRCGAQHLRRPHPAWAEGQQSLPCGKDCPAAGITCPSHGPLLGLGHHARFVPPQPPPKQTGTALPPAHAPMPCDVWPALGVWGGAPCLAGLPVRNRRRPAPRPRPLASPTAAPAPAPRPIAPNHSTLSLSVIASECVNGSKALMTHPVHLSVTRFSSRRWACWLRMVGVGVRGCVWLSARAHVCVSVCVHACVHAGARAHARVCVSVFVSVRACVRVPVRVSCAHAASQCDGCALPYAMLTGMGRGSPNGGGWGRQPAQAGPAGWSWHPMSVCHAH